MVVICPDLNESVDLVEGEVEPGEVEDPGQDHQLDHLEVVVTQVDLHQPRPPLRAEPGVGESLQLVVPEAQRLHPGELRHGEDGQVDEGEVGVVSPETSHLNNMIDTINKLTCLCIPWSGSWKYSC